MAAFGLALTPELVQGGPPTITIREDVAEDWGKVVTFGAVVQREDNALAVRQ